MLEGGWASPGLLVRATRPFPPDNPVVRHGGDAQPLQQRVAKTLAGADLRPAHVLPADERLDLAAVAIDVDADHLQAAIVVLVVDCPRRPCVARADRPEVQHSHFAEQIARQSQRRPVEGGQRGVEAAVGEDGDAAVAEECLGRAPIGILHQRVGQLRGERLIAVGRGHIDGEHQGHVRDRAIRVAGNEAFDLVRGRRVAQVELGKPRLGEQRVGPDLAFDRARRSDDPPGQSHKPLPRGVVGFQRGQSPGDLQHRIANDVQVGGVGIGLFERFARAESGVRGATAST